MPALPLKDGRTRMAYKSEHAVDLETGAIVGVTIHPADCSDTTTIQETLQVSVGNLHNVHTTYIMCITLTYQTAKTMTKKDLLVVRTGQQTMKENGYRTYIPEKRQAGRRRWTDKGGKDTAAA